MNARAVERPGRSGIGTALDSVIDHSVRSLFTRHSGLSGFVVIDARAMIGEREAGRLQGDLSLADITVSSGFATKGEDYFAEIAMALIDLIDEWPEARALLRDRTFARTLN